MNMSPQAKARREAEAFKKARKYVARWLPIRSRESVEKGLYTHFCMTLTEDNDVRWYYG